MRGDNRSRALTVSAGSTPLIFDLATRGKVRNAKRGSQGTRRSDVVLAPLRPAPARDGPLECGGRVE
jgi:hypothetical protein